MAQYKNIHKLVWMCSPDVVAVVWGRLKPRDGLVVVDAMTDDVCPDWVPVTPAPNVAVPMVRGCDNVEGELVEVVVFNCPAICPERLKPVELWPRGRFMEAPDLLAVDGTPFPAPNENPEVVCDVDEVTAFEANWRVGAVLFACTKLDAPPSLNPGPRDVAEVVLDVGPPNVKLVWPEVRAVEDVADPNDSPCLPVLTRLSLAPNFSPELVDWVDEKDSADDVLVCNPNPPGLDACPEEPNKGVDDVVVCEANPPGWVGCPEEPNNGVDDMLVCNPNLSDWVGCAEEPNNGVDDVLVCNLNPPGWVGCTEEPNNGVADAFVCNPGPLGLVAWIEEPKLNVAELAVVLAPKKLLFDVNVEAAVFGAIKPLNKAVDEPLPAFWLFADVLPNIPVTATGLARLPALVPNVGRLEVWVPNRGAEVLGFESDKEGLMVDVPKLKPWLTGLPKENAVEVVAEKEIIEKIL